MTRTRFLTLFGDLVNTLLSRILSEIESHADIGEEESKQMNQLCKMLHDLDSLFAQGESVSVSLYCILVLEPRSRILAAFTYPSGSSSSSSARFWRLQW